MPARSPEAIERHRELRREASRAAKQKRRGTCEECGGETRYNGGPTAAPDGTSRLCDTCARALHAERSKAQIGTGKLQTAILEHLRRHETARRIELQAAAETTNDIISPTLQRMLAQGLIERVSRGVYRLPEGSS